MRAYRRRPEGYPTGDLGGDRRLTRAHWALLGCMTQSQRDCVIQPRVGTTLGTRHPPRPNPNGVASIGDANIAPDRSPSAYGWHNGRADTDATPSGLWGHTSARFPGFCEPLGCQTVPLWGTRHPGPIPTGLRHTALRYCTPSAYSGRAVNALRIMLCSPVFREEPEKAVQYEALSSFVGAATSREGSKADRGDSPQNLNQPPGVFRARLL